MSLYNRKTTPIQESGLLMGARQEQRLGGSWNPDRFMQLVGLKLSLRRCLRLPMIDGRLGIVFFNEDLMTGYFLSET